MEYILDLYSNGIIEKNAFKVQIKFLAMHITNQKLRFNYVEKRTKYLYGTWSLLNILIIARSLGHFPVFHSIDWS